MKAAMKKAACWPIALALAGCAPTMPRADARFGLEVRALLAAQAMPPSPGTRALPAADGVAARAALTAYRRPAPLQTPGAGGNAIATAVGSAR